MATVAHTPGPWRADWEHGLIRAPDESTVARMPLHSQGSTYGEANCLLLAGAPDLLVALKEIEELARHALDRPLAGGAIVFAKIAGLAQKAIVKVGGR